MGNDERELLEAFVVNNPDLEYLEALLAKFNLFEAVGTVRQELRHSDFLAFLLDPRGNHRLGDAFLKRLLKHILVAMPAPPLSAVEIDVADLDDAEVRREWQHIDILVHDPATRLVCAIENKIDSSEHSGQLCRYRKIVQRRFGDQRMLFVYLTPEGVEPSDDAYFALDYKKVADIVDAVRRSRESTLGADVRTLLEHYTTMLRRHIVTDSEIAELCRKLYQEHKQALDLIYEHRPDLQYELYEYLKQLIEDSLEEHELVPQHSTKSQIHFAIKDWDDHQAQHMGEGSRDRILTFRFANGVDYLHLRFVIGPGPQRVRQALFQEFKKHPDIFSHASGQVGQTHKTVHQRTHILGAGDYEDPDLDQMKEKVQKVWQDFLRDDLKRIKKVVAQLPWDSLAEKIRVAEV